MTSPSFEAETHLHALEGALGLAVDPTWRPGVLANLETLARMAALVQAGPLDDTDEPAFVFEADR